MYIHTAMNAWMPAKLPSRTLALGLLLLLLSAGTSGQAIYLFTKAQLAQHLLGKAWQQSRILRVATRPWHWADMQTVARLSYKLDHQKTPSSLFVLSDASGESLAFGPGLVFGNPADAKHSTVTIGGHRDSHLAFLEHAAHGMEFELEDLNGITYQYRLVEKFVLDTQHQQLQIPLNKTGLVLVTCYPFQATQTGGPLRLIASAELIVHSVSL